MRERVKAEEKKTERDVGSEGGDEKEGIEDGME